MGERGREREKIKSVAQPWTEMRSRVRKNYEANFWGGFNLMEL